MVKKVAVAFIQRESLKKDIAWLGDNGNNKGRKIQQ